MKRIASVLFWSVISAAFIGPGTVTAAASAGARFSFSLLWALLFSTVSCLVLQEASARLTVVSGRNLGQTLRERYPGGVGGVMLLALVLGAVIVGCAAYEAGNILGGVAGAVLAIPLSPALLTLATVTLAAVLLWFNSPRRIAVVLSGLVALMGVSFLVTAVSLEPPILELVKGSFIPSLPESSSLLAVALVGTTVVPYNLFLGSGLAGGQKLGELRFGLTVAILLGGLISMGVLVVGTAVEGTFTFDALSGVLSERLGTWSRYLFAMGLFAAGLTSAVTAPLAAAVTARSVLGKGSGGADARWSNRSLRFRATWIAVLGVGLLFGLSGVRPIPVIILAQALNGILLPVVAVFLLIVVSDRRSMGTFVNGRWANLAMGVIVIVALFLGLTNVVRAASRAIGSEPPGVPELIWLTAAVAVLGAVPLWKATSRSSGQTTSEEEV